MAQRQNRGSDSSRGVFSWNILTFDRMVAGEIILLVYWAGLGVIALIGFSMVGAGVGLALHGGGLAGWLLGAPVMLGGVLAVVALTLLWRATCEFYIAIFRISDDLHAIRRSAERDATTRVDRTPGPGY